MSRYIDADKLKQDLDAWAINLHKPTNLVREDTFVIIDEQPTADVVEVVRCKDCKYGEENYKSPIYGMWCKRFGAEKSNLAVLPTDYCSYGERKEK